MPTLLIRAPAPQELPSPLHAPVMAVALPAALATAPLGRGMLLLPSRCLLDPSHNNFGGNKDLFSCGGLAGAGSHGMGCTS